MFNAVCEVATLVHIASEFNICYQPSLKQSTIFTSVTYDALHGLTANKRE